jgi:two-component system response regulator AtoC
MVRGKILTIDDEKNIRHLIQSEFALEGFQVVTAESGEEGLRQFEKENFDMVLLDLKLPEMDGLEALQRLKQKSSATEVIMITGHGEIESAVAAMKLGARDYVTKPFKLGELITLAKQIMQDRQSLRSDPKTKETMKRSGGEAIHCPSSAMEKVYRAIEKIAPTDATVLIDGETGVGKDVLAGQIHRTSARNKAPFIVLDCGLLNHNLAESELYGHRKGAFSGADEKKIGLVEKSDRGTLFLDEIGNINLDLQKKFLRFLETGRFRRVGETDEVQVDARIVLATNVNLHNAMEKGRLREDLFYRMNCVSLTIPPLRERPEDIPPLVDHIITKYSGNEREVSREALDILARYHWPGNIRELKSAITKALIFADDTIISADDLPRYLSAKRKATVRRPKTLEEMEKDHIIAVLAETGGNQSKAAEILGINRKTLYKKIHKFKIFS